jgi:hypothetical protein
MPFYGVCARVFTKRPGSILKVGGTGKNKGKKGIQSQVSGIFKLFCGAFNGFGACTQELFWKTKHQKKVVFLINSRFWDCFWG